MAQDKTKQVLIRVSPDTKEDWEDAAEDGGFRGLSGFIRFAVNNEIEGRNGGRDTTVEIDTEDIVDAVEDAVTDHTREITRRLSSIEGAIEGLHEELDGKGEGTVAAELVFEGLPSASPYKRDDDGQKVEKSHDELVAQSKPPAEIADEIGVPTAPVKRTLEQLDLESERVYSVELADGERRYFGHV